MEYIQASLGWLLALDTWKFVKESELVSKPKTRVPSYLWEPLGYGNKRPANSISKTHKLQFNNLKVALTRKLGNADIEFFDAVKGDTVAMRLTAAKNVTESGIGWHAVGGVGHSVWRLIGEDYESVPFRSAYTSFSDEHKFFPVEDLATQEVVGDNAEVLSYGVVPIQYTLKYNGMRLSQQRFAFLCGSWAILLNDDMTFNSLVVLKGVSHYTLEIESILYTVDSRMLKASMRMKW